MFNEVNNEPYFNIWRTITSADVCTWAIYLSGRMHVGT